MPLPGTGPRDRQTVRALLQAGARQTLIFLLRVYKLGVSPYLPSACRFYPTCSDYMCQSIELHGSVRGIWLGVKRLCRCHPFHAGGVDPVPHA